MHACFAFLSYDAECQLNAFVSPSVCEYFIFKRYAACSISNIQQLRGGCTYQMQTKFPVTVWPSY